MGLQKSIPLAGAVLLAIYALLAVFGPAVLDPSWLSLLYLTLYFICLAAAWNLFSGFSGYINFGFVAFIGIGMYAAVIAIVDLRMPPIPAYLVGGLAAALFAAVIGYPLLKIRGAYFSIAMLAVAEGTRVLIATEYLEPFTRGGRGIPVLASSLTERYYAMLVVTAAVLLASLAIARSRFGLALIAVREDEAAADGLGINTTMAKVAAFIVSAFFAGVAGGIHATFVHYIDPNAAFDIRYTVMPIIMTIFGGIGTVLGPVIGGLILEVISDYTWLYLGRMNLPILGLILIALVLWMPDGLIVRLKEAGILPKTRTI